MSEKPRNHRIQYWFIEPQEVDNPPDFRQLPGLLGALPWTIGGRYVERYGDEYALWDQELDVSTRLGFVMGRIRRGPLTAELAGDLTTLPLPNGHGRAEPAHFLLCSSNVLAVEYNHFGPRASRLPWYLSKAAAQFPRFELQRVVSERTAQKLARLETIKLATFSFYTDRAGELLGKDSLAAAFHDMRSEGSVEKFRLQLSPARGQGLGGKVMSLCRKILSSPEPERFVSSARVEGLLESGERDKVDLLSDFYATSVQVPPAKDYTTTAAWSAAVLRAMEVEYLRQQDDVQRAAFIRQEDEDEA